MGMMAMLQNKAFEGDGCGGVVNDDVEVIVVVDGGEGIAAAAAADDDDDDDGDNDGEDNQQKSKCNRFQVRLVQHIPVSRLV